MYEFILNTCVRMEPVDWRRDRKLQIAERHTCPEFRGSIWVAGENAVQLCWIQNNQMKREPTLKPRVPS